MLKLFTQLKKKIQSLKKKNLIRQKTKTWSSSECTNLNQLEYYLIFRNGEHLFNRFCKNGFGHVFALIKTSKQILCLDPLVNRFFIGIVHEEDIKIAAKAYCNEGATVVRVRKVPAQVANRWSYFSISPCVHYIIYLVGISGIFLTPYSLYRYLMKTNKFFVEEIK